jgi:hypothetical protein
MNQDKQVLSWIQNLVNAKILKYEEINNELVITQGKNYHKAPPEFRSMFEETGHKLNNTD